MTDYIIEVADRFWNIRGSYKVAGLLDVGTQASLVQLVNGRFVLLDTYSFNTDTADLIAERTDGGKAIEAIINLHPFHTMHVEYAHALYPHAALHGTARHISRFPNLPWHDLKSEDEALHAQYAADFEFSVPRGVDFISANENVHFSSVLALHKASQTIHSDDTLNYMGLPGAMRMLGLGDKVSFHPTLAKALQRRPGAAQDFRDWAEAMIEQWREAKNLCAAHTTYLLEEDNEGDSIYQRMRDALDKVGSTLEAHEQKHG